MFAIYHRYDKAVDPSDIHAVTGTRQDIYERILELRNGAKKEEDEFLQKAREAVAYVTRVVSIQSQEVKENLEAQTSALESRVGEVAEQQRRTGRQWVDRWFDDGAPKFSST